ncbi:MAG: hypothetical protein HPY64_06635 [Anaerolineae bacterium]|nr:hypothetical protein [Anaerolineae bacterium]
MHGMKMLPLLLLGLLVLGAGCLPQPTLRSDLFLDDTSVVTGEPCAAPCWRNITPGETSWTEAIEIIRADDSLSDPEVNTEEQGVVQALWQKAGSNQYCCRLLADSENDPVSYVFLALSPRTIVDSVISAHGDPTYVTTFQFTDAESVVQLIYPEVPMVVSVLVGDAQSSLLANSTVVAVLYMSPEEMALILDTTELQAWAGYQSYSAYSQATPVVTPRVTLTPPPQ